MSMSMKLLVAAALVGSLGGLVPAQAETVMQQCGQQYQAAKAAGTLGGMSWKQFRTDCAAKLKAEPAAAAAPAAVAPASPAPAPAPANPLKPATAVTAPAAPATAPAATAAPAKATGGRAAMLARERQCGAEWKAQKASLIAQTPGLTWPKYWSQCNTRLKASGQ